MRLSIALLAFSLLGVVAGASLVGAWAVGCAVIFDSVCVGLWALFHDDGEQSQPMVHGPAEDADVRAFIERARRVS